MIVALAIFCLLLSAAGYYRYRDYISPAVLAPLPWGMVLLMYGVFNHGMDDLSAKVLGVILLWVVALTAVVWLFSEVSFSKVKERKIVEKFNPSVRTIYYWVAILMSIPLFYIGYKQATTMMAGGFLFNLRMANTGMVESEYNYGIWQYAFTFAYVSLLIELFSYKKGDSKVRVIVLIVLNLVQAVITMAKSTFFFLFLAILFSTMFKRKLKTSTLVIGLSAVMLLLSSIQLLRAGDKEDVVSDMFYVYVMGGVPALDQIVSADMHTTQAGVLTLGFFNNVTSAMGLTEKSQHEFRNDITDDGYVFVPLPTNVFTAIGVFWWDFGYWGVAIFGFIIGGFAGLLYRLARNGRLWAVITYAYVACTLVLQFFGEYIFTNLSYTIQIVALTLVAYKFRYLIKWR